MELERPSWVWAKASPEGVGAGHSTAIGRRQHNCDRGKALQPRFAFRIEPLGSVLGTNRPQDRAIVLRSTLHQAARVWRRLGGEPCEGEPHARFGEGSPETRPVRPLRRFRGMVRRRPTLLPLYS